MLEEKKRLSADEILKLEEEIKVAITYLEAIEGKKQVYLSMEDLKYDYMIFSTEETDVDYFLGLIDEDKEVIASDLGCMENGVILHTENATVRLMISEQMLNELNENDEDYDSDEDACMLVVDYVSYDYSLEHLM